MASQTDKSAREVKPQGPELRLLDRRAFVGFPSLTVAPGITLTDFALQIPDVTFPFNVTGGATRYQRKKLDFGFLEVSIDAEVITRKVAELAGKLSELDDVKLLFRPGYLEGQARLRSSERAALTFKVAFDGDGERLAVYLYDVRFYAFSVTPAAQLPALISRSLEELGLLPEVELRGANGFSTRILPPLVQLAAVGRGFKMPSLDQARLAAAEVSGRGLRLRFASGGLPPPAPPDEELLLTLEGARAFADAEELLAQGKLAEAREAYLRHGDAQDAHPFAAERLLTLLVADPQAHELALDLAQALARRRERSATALWAEAVVRERRGESARAAERYLAVCALARKNQEQAAAFFSAESAARAARDQAPQMAVRALHELLGLKPDHLPSLQALARASDLANDRAGAIRAYRRIAALARDPAEAADAHVHMARLCALTEDDVAGARLHCEAALRLSPDHPDALLQLGELCHKAGEHLRAIKALDRLREVALGRHEVDRIARANLLAGLVWETGLEQLENALLRYREAAALLPGEAEPLFLCARVAERLGKLQEALSGYQQAIELAGPAPRADAVRKAAHQSRHALARLCRTKLSDPARAREHLEAALALDPTDMVAIEELLPYFRASGKAAELADALEKAAAVTEDPSRRASFWAEAGELYRGRLGNLEKADRLLAAALEADPKNQLALEGMLALAESRRDGGQLCQCLKSLAELSADPKERVRYHRRLAVAARDLAFDLDLAAQALSKVLEIEPDDLPALGELCGLQRRRADVSGLAQALEQRARAAEAHGDKRLASAALRELAQVLEVRLGRVGEALVALEKAARLSPDSSVLLDLANLSLRCERPEHARRALEDLLSTMPRHAAPDRVAEVRSRLGRACELLGDHDAARENYALAFPLRRLDDELAHRLESLYEESGQLRELTDLWAARAQALVAAGRAGDAAPLFFKSAQSLLREGDHAGAILRLTAALDAAPQGGQAGEILEAMAELELGRGEKLEAAKLYARRAGLLGEPRAAARMLFKAATLASGTPREAGFLAESLVKDGGFAPARIRRASLLFEGDPRGALADLEAVLGGDKADPDAPPEGERLQLTRRAGFAALRAGLLDTARKHLALYAAHRPDDLEARRQLVTLHRRAGAKEALCDLLGELWSSLEEGERKAARREYAELSLELGRSAPAIDVLRRMLGEEPGDLWAARTLLGLLPAQDATSSERTERLHLLGVLIDAASGDERADLLTRRARLLREGGRSSEARADLVDAAGVASRPGPLLKELAEAARDDGDEAGELSAWRAAVEKDPDLTELAAARILQLSRSRLEANDAALAREGFSAAARLALPAAELCEAHLGVADAAQAQGDLGAAAAALQDASRQGPAKRRVEALLRRAELLEGLGDAPAAGQSYEAALALAPRHPAATAGLKRVLRDAEDWAGLAEVLAAEAAQTPKAQAAPLFAELGALYLDRLEQRGPAEAAFRRAAQLDGQDVEVRRRLFTLLSEKGELTEAVALLEEAAGVLPPQEGASLLRDAVGRARAAGDAELSLRLARRAHALEPARGEDLHELTDLLYVRGAVREALPLQQRLAAEASFEDAPDVAEAVFLRLADLAEQNGERELAERTLRRLVQERPLCAAAVERLSALVHPQNPREAIELFARYAVELVASERAVTLLVGLAERARAELSDVELSARLLRRATELSAEPLPLHRSLAALFREAGRTHELMEELVTIGHLELEAGEVESAIAAYEEEARLAEQTGRIDEALKTLQSIVEICEDEGKNETAASYERLRAEMLRDAKLDLDAAEAALRRSFELNADPQTVQLAISLARRRDDREGEIDWLERSIDLHVDGAARAAAFIQLARLHLGLRSEESPRPGPSLEHAPLTAPDQAEAALREAIRLVPSRADAEALLLALFERQGRLGEIAAYYEEAALRTQDLGERAQLLLKAAETYKDRAGKPHAAAAALIAARAARPDDAALTAQAADMLHEVGLPQDAAEFDALLLEQDPFHRAFERHADFLRSSGDHQGIAALLLRRAERQSGAEAAASYLQAAAAFRVAGADERALLCESQAFEAHPASDEAFAAMRRRAAGDVRRLSALLQERARALPDQAVVLLRERAGALSAAGEALLAAEALDDLLAVAPDDEAALSARAELAAQSGGPSAAQPYDRRLLSVAEERLPLPVRVKTRMRLGHAAMNAAAFQDAADCFQAVVELDPEGERGGEALSLLSEVHARSGNARGQYETSLRLAKRARPDEAEALLRRAAELLEDPAEAMDALLPLARLRPADADVVERAARGLEKLGRHGELLDLLEKSADAVGGSQAAERLLRAASVAEAELHDAAKASELRRRATRVDPENTAALFAIVEEQRRTGDALALLAAVEQLAAATRDPDEAAPLRLEVAQLAVKAGDDARARRALEPLIARGAKGAGYPAALETLEALLLRAGDDAGLSKVLAARAELASGDQRAELLLASAQATARTGDKVQAAALVRRALESRATVEGLVLLASLSRELAQPAKAAAALVQAAGLSPKEAAGPLLVEAAEAWEAAGDSAEALDLVQRLAREHPGLIKPADLAARFERLGALAVAVEHGFAPAMAAGQFERALQLADGARDAGKAREALWALALRDGGGPHAFRLASELRESRDPEGLFRLGELCERSGANEHAYSLFEELFLEAGVELKRASLAKLVRWGQLAKLLSSMEGSLARPDATRMELLLEVGGAQPPPARELILELAAEALPARAPSLVRELFELRRGEGRHEEAAAALERLVSMEEDVRARSALRVELGELFLGPLSQPARAREAFELALADDQQSAAAVTRLLGLYGPADEPERFLAMAEHLARLAGPEANEERREAMVEAYQKVGRTADAYRLLSELPETPERLAERARLAEALGRAGEALPLRERLAKSPSELEEVLLGYVAAGLTPFAVRLGTRMFEEGTLTAAVQRILAERLSPQEDGAAFAVRLWPSLLRERVVDADGWTLFAEALRAAGRTGESEMIDGFGAALTSSTALAPQVRLAPVHPERSRGASGRASSAAGSGGSLKEISEAAMPRLQRTLADALTGLGAPEVRAFLDVKGGAWAYLAGEDELVLGAGALACFGPTELTYLCALALALGERGLELSLPGKVEGLEEAAATAFAACPCSLAAARVLAQLDERVRGGDPSKVRLEELLPGSEAFRAIALEALRLVSGG